MLDQMNPGSRRQILLAIDRIAKRRKEARDKLKPEESAT